MSAQSDRIGRELAAQLDALKLRFAERLQAKLFERTPKRTGYTASRWKVEVDAAGDVVISNDQGEVVTRLNDGSSRQAPEAFIEQAIAEVTAEMEREVAQSVRVE